MKKAVSLIFTLFMLFSFAVSVNAEEFNGADLFAIDIPKEFEQTQAGSSDFSFKNEEGDTFTVSYNDNTDEEYIFSPADMSKKDIEEYTNLLSEESKNIMVAYADEFELEFLNAEKIKLESGKTAIACKTRVYIKTKDKETVHYQTMYEIGGANYKYTFTYTTADKEKKDALDSTLASINVFEAETESNLDKLTGYAVAVGLALLLVMGIIRFIRTPEKRAQGKLK